MEVTKNNWKKETQEGKYYTVKEGREMVIRYRSGNEFKAIATIPSFYKCDMCIAETITQMLNMNEVSLNLEI